MRIAVKLAGVVVSTLLLCVIGWGLWAVGSWVGYGHPALRASGDTIIARLIPHPEVVEYHERMVTASPAAAYRATQRFALDDSPVIRAIIRVRALVLGAQPDTIGTRQPLAQQALAGGWALMAEVPGREMVFGTVTQPWQADVRFHALPSDRFATFDSAGWVKIVWNIAVDSLGPDRARIRTETRVATTDPTARARFRRYWALFSPGIILIRHEALSSIRRAL